MVQREPARVSNIFFLLPLAKFTTANNIFFFYVLLSIKYETYGRRGMPTLTFDREKSRQKGDATSASPVTSCFISDMNISIRKILRSLSAKNTNDFSFIRPSVNRTVGQYLE